MSDARIADPRPAGSTESASSATGESSPARTGNAAGNGGRTASSIVLKGVRKSFGRAVVALEHVDLEIAAGEFFTLLGPSGCGKTTLLRILAGLDRADSGEIRIGGRDIAATAAHRRSVNTVFQSYALFPHLNVRDNIAFGLRMRGVRREEYTPLVEKTAAFIKIGELLDRSVDQLSGGQAQRVALARALINQPDVLLLDEPLSALDAGLRTDLQVELLQTQKRLGMTFVFVTHDQQEAMVMSDRIAVLNEGRIQQVGSPREVYERPANLFVARFMGHTNVYPVERLETGSVRTSFGQIDGLAHGAGDHVLIRPETLDLLPAGETGPNRIPARVAACLYRGSWAEYHLDCNGTRVTATISNRGQSVQDIGDEVTLVVDPETAFFIGEEGAMA